MKIVIQTIITKLKSIVFKTMSIRIFGTVIGGVYGFILGFLIDRVLSKSVGAFLNLLLRKGYLLYDKTQGKILVKKLNKAKEENNEEDYNSTIDNL